jgi:glutamate-1-semialdehyde aminotransferase
MVRYGKNGSDATTAAVRLARAHTGRDRIAVCGYHGWHDWYIGTTARDAGVPAAVKELSVSFPFNDADAFEALLKKAPDGYAAVIVEPAGVTPPAPGFLQRLRELTERHGVVLIFDEIVTGFRVALGGAQEYYGVTPDLAAFGKSMGNGMPISAIVGRREIMMLMEEIFFSATFGGEALSIAAAIATIDKLERDNGVGRLWARGEALRNGANRLLDRHGFGNFARFEGDGWWPRLKIGDAPVDSVLLASLLRQEFVANGLLLFSSFNLCLAHDSDAITEETLAAADRALGAVRAALDSPDPAASLRGELIQPTFAVR